MVSLIITMLNEAESISYVLGDVMAQSRCPDELVIVDAGSTDGTVEVIESRRSDLAAVGIDLMVRVEPEVNVACGRNIAVAAARNEIICGTDAGCRLDPDWVRAITSPIVAGEADFVGGFYLPVHRTDFQRVLSGLTVAETPPPGFLPSSRSISFTKSIWDAAGRYPEGLMWGEDTLFNERCLAAGARYVVAPDAIVHWEVRRTPRAAMRQYFYYARGDGERRRISASHVVNVGAVFGAIILGVFISPAWLLLFPAYAGLVVLGASSRLRSRDMPYAWVLAMGLRSARALGWVRGFLYPEQSRTHRSRA